MSSSSSRVWSLLLGTSTVAALAGPARADQPAGRWEAGVGLGFGVVRVDDPALSDAASGGGAGLVASAGYVGRAGVGLMLDASLWRNSPGSCAADGACFNQRAERIAMAGAALRWHVRPAVYVQGGLGAALTREQAAGRMSEQWWSPVGSVAIGVRRAIPDALVGLELRTSVLRNDTTWVSSVSAVLSLGHAW